MSIKGADRLGDFLREYEQYIEGDRPYAELTINRTEEVGDMGSTITTITLDERVRERLNVSGPSPESRIAAHLAAGRITKEEAAMLLALRHEIRRARERPPWWARAFMWILPWGKTSAPKARARYRNAL